MLLMFPTLHMILGRHRDIINIYDPQSYIASPVISDGTSENNVLILEKIAQPGPILFQFSRERVFTAFTSNS